MRDISQRERHKEGERIDCKSAKEKNIYYSIDVYCIMCSSVLAITDVYLL